LPQIWLSDICLRQLGQAVDGSFSSDDTGGGGDCLPPFSSSFCGLRIKRIGKRLTSI
jgi:hypothetical protein